MSIGTKMLICQFGNAILVKTAVNHMKFLYAQPAPDWCSTYPKPDQPAPFLDSTLIQLSINSVHVQTSWLQWWVVLCISDDHSIFGKDWILNWQNMIFFQFHDQPAPVSPTMITT